MKTNRKFDFLQSCVRKDIKDLDLAYLTKWLFNDYSIPDKEYFDQVKYFLDIDFFDKNNTIREQYNYYSPQLKS